MSVSLNRASWRPSDNALFWNSYAHNANNSIAFMISPKYFWEFRSKIALWDWEHCLLLQLFIVLKSHTWNIQAKVCSMYETPHCTLSLREWNHQRVMRLGCSKCLLRARQFKKNSKIVAMFDFLELTIYHLCPSTCSSVQVFKTRAFSQVIEGDRTFSVFHKSCLSYGLLIDRVKRNCNQRSLNSLPPVIATCSCSSFNINSFL